MNGRISEEFPLGRALLGKAVGDGAVVGGPCRDSCTIGAEIEIKAW